jgi:hypothetical protein
MALLVQIRSERAASAYGGAVELQGNDRDRNRELVAGTLRAMAEQVERGMLDDLLVVEAMD